MRCRIVRPKIEICLRLRWYRDVAREWDWRRLSTALNADAKSMEDCYF
jgi:hypothetical protein